VGQQIGTTAVDSVALAVGGVVTGKIVSGVKGGTAADTVTNEVAALERIGQNPVGPVLEGKAPNSVLNQQLINDLNAGKLPGTPIGGPGTPREMPISPNPSATAENFANGFFGGTKPSNATPIPNCSGCWYAKASDGTFVTYRPAGQASAGTLPTTATVEVNSPTINALNASSNGQQSVLKLKFQSN
jgi:filamentous hemagglutinin